MYIVNSMAAFFIDLHHIYPLFELIYAHARLQIGRLQNGTARREFADALGGHPIKVVEWWQSQHRSYNQGLISADRSNKATLLLTIPRCLLSRLQRISRAQLVKLQCSERGCELFTGPRHNHMVQAEAIDTRVIGQPFSFLAWILF